jgi:hypothetical protein
MHFPYYHSADMMGCCCLKADYCNKNNKEDEKVVWDHHARTNVKHTGSRNDNVMMVDMNRG